MIPIKPVGPGYGTKHGVAKPAVKTDDALSAAANSAAAYLKPGVLNLTALPPLSLYIHIPWCVRKCPYCDFNSHNAPQQLPQREYVDALLRDLDQDLPLAQARELQSIFFGGGTPSLFSADSIARILDGVNARLAFAPRIEVTLETNPGTVEHAPFAGYRDAGVNRISFGVQSFDDAALQRIGR